LHKLRFRSGAGAGEGEENAGCSILLHRGGGAAQGDHRQTRGLQRRLKGTDVNNTPAFSRKARATGIEWDELQRIAIPIEIFVVCCQQLIITCIDGRAAGEQGMGFDKATIVGKRRQARIGRNAICTGTSCADNPLKTANQIVVVSVKLTAQVRRTAVGVDVASNDGILEHNNSTIVLNTTRIKAGIRKVIGDRTASQCQGAFAAIDAHFLIATDRGVDQACA
jgi:hypothetical protein